MFWDVLKIVAAFTLAHSITLSLAALAVIALPSRLVGFASVLADLGLPRDALVVALVGFNLGVEVGQLAIVGLFLPVAYGLRRTWLYRRMIFIGGSALIALIAAVWMAERVFVWKLMPL